MATSRRRKASVAKHSSKHKHHCLEKLLKTDSRVRVATKGRGEHVTGGGVELSVWREDSPWKIDLVSVVRGVAMNTGSLR